MSFSLRPVCRPCRVAAVLLAAALFAAGPAHPEAAPSGEWRQLNGQSTTAVLWQRQAAEYRALCHQAFQLADRRVYSAVLRLSGFRRVPPHPRYHPDRERLAVVLDLDETLLDNGPYLAAVAQSDTAGRERLALWNRWIDSGRQEALPGAVRFLNHLRRWRIQAFYVTNRGPQDREATLRTLQRLGFPDADEEHLFLNGGDGNKQPVFEKLEKRYRVLCYLGDSLTDFPLGTARMDEGHRNAAADAQAADFGTRFILLPNPVYGRWEQVLADGSARQDAAERLAARAALLQRAEWHHGAGWK
ncbi:MAG: hypothetical protein I3I94_05055 [Acidaminococcaceae bacterium]|nr:hypothetical protein [Acidaminococcaceae bacterium]